LLRRPPRSTLSSSSAASDVYKRQDLDPGLHHLGDRRALGDVGQPGALRLVQPGRVDPLVTAARARAVCFAAGEPAGLSVTMPGVLAQLREVTGPDAAVLLGFDRGGSYPCLLYTSDAADEEDSVDLGGSR